MSKIDCIINMIRGISPENIQADTELIESGIISSVELFELVSQIEETFGIQIDVELIDYENFTTPEKIAEVFLEEV